MLLGLSDILATQAVERPQSQAASSLPNFSGSTQSFSDYLNTQQDNLPNAVKHSTNTQLSNNSNQSSRDIIYTASEPLNRDISRRQDSDVVSSFNNNIQRYDDSPRSYTQDSNSSAQNLSSDDKAALTDLYHSLQDGEKLSDANIKTLQKFFPELLGVNVPAGVSGDQIAAQLALQPSASKALAAVINNFVSNANVSTPLSATTTPVQQAITKDDLLNALSQLQNSAGSQTTGDSSSSNKLQVDIAGLSSSQLKILNSVLSRIAENGVPTGLSANDVIAQVVAQLKDAKSDFSVTVDDILQKINLTNAGLSQNPSAAQLATLVLANQPNGTDISGVAKNVIAAAKNEAARPQVTASDIKAQLVDSNSEDNNKNAQAENTNVLSAIVLNNTQLDSNAALIVTSGTPIDISPTVNPAPVHNAIQNPANQQQLNGNLAANINIDPNDSANPANNIINNIPQVNPFNTSAIDALKQVVSQNSDSRVDVAAVGEIGSSGANLLSGMSSENFVKFQNMLGDAQTMPAGTSSKMPAGAGSPEDVMAQIKFGMGAGVGGSTTSNISVQLRPKELGKVDISIQVASDGKTHVMVMAEKTDTLNMLQKESSSLRGMLTDALKTDSGNLNFSFQQSGSDAWKQQFADNQFGNQKITDSDLSGLNNDYLSAQSYAYRMIATQGLDIRV